MIDFHRLAHAFNPRETAMFGSGMVFTGSVAFETVDGSWAVLIGMLMVVLSGLEFFVVREGKDA